MLATNAPVTVIEAAIREPGAKSFGILTVLAALIVAGGFLIKRWLEKRKDLKGSKRE